MRDDDLTDLGLDDEPAQPKKSVGATPNRWEEPVEKYTTPTIDSGYTIVKKDKGEHKGSSGEIVIETSTRGLIYNCEVLKDGVMIDGEEVDCSDLQSKGNKNALFRDRYTATHNNFKRYYIAEEFFKKVLQDEGEYKDDNKQHCIVKTFVSDDTIKSIIEIDGVEFDKREIPLDDAMKSKQSLIESKYKTIHSDMASKYIDEDKFPVNIGWLDKILRKLPFYKKNPMYSFYFLLGIIFLFFYLIKMAMCSDFVVNGKKGKKRFEYLASYAPYCSDFQERIIKGCDKSHNGLWKLKSKVFTTKTCKSACVDYDFIDGEICDKWTMSMNNTNGGTGGIKVDAYTITPEGELELTQKDFTTIYLKNNTTQTLRFKIVGRKIIDNSNSAIIMFANGKTEVALDPNEEDSFKLRLEHTYIGSFASGEYHGEVLFAVYNDDKSVDTTETRKIKFTID
jgi:hypothetical protein